MSTFVLIHGGWHGAWCWYKVKRRLELAGHRVVAPDLPSLGIDRTPIAHVSLDAWTNSVCEILTLAPEPVILVGHSRGGIVISQAAEKCPDKVKSLVYLAAFLVPNGESLLQVLQEDTTSMLHGNVVFADDQSFTTVREEAVREIFYQRCQEDDIVLAKSLLAPEAVAPSATPLHITQDRFGQVRRAYIECTFDHAIPLSLQRQMCARLPCHKIMAIDSDHSPFLSAPEALVEQLISLSSWCDAA